MKSYTELRHRIQPGDVIAFSGKGLPSETVKLATRSAVSHVGIIMEVLMQEDGPHPQVMESSPIEGFRGVAVKDLGDRLQAHPGNVWWLPLSQSVRLTLDAQKLREFLQRQNHKPYDPWQAINSALDFAKRLPLVGRFVQNPENYDQLFCSELVVAGLKASGTLEAVNASEITPAELCALSLYGPQYHLLKLVDPDVEIEGFNSVKPQQN